MAHDGVGADLEGLPIAGDLADVLALQALGGELDRRQRILDLVRDRSEEHTSELQSLMRISYAVFCLTKKNTHILTNFIRHTNIYIMYSNENQIATRI